MKRYDRQIKASVFGEQGQKQLSHAKFLIVGAGALAARFAKCLHVVVPEN